MSLEDIRSRIDSLDAEIIRLLDRRADAGREAAEAKRRLGLPLRNPAREREVLDRLGERSDGSMPRRGLENIYRTIMAETLTLEGPEAACPGRRGAADRMDTAGVVMENVETAPGVFRMRVRSPELGRTSAPGQFFQFRVLQDNVNPFLRRPFAPSETTPEGFSFHYAVVGDGTERMSGLPAGSEVRVLGPLGRGYTLLPRGASALLIGGGCGAPSLLPLARKLREDGAAVTAAVGARTEVALLERHAFAEAADRLVLATDDGSAGHRANAVDALRLDGSASNRRYDRVYACGPMPMLKAAATLAVEMDVPCEVSLEERMACGFGACVGCAVPVRDAAAEDGYSYRRVCHDGPVFDASVLAWDRQLNFTPHQSTAAASSGGSA